MGRRLDTSDAQIDQPAETGCPAEMTCQGATTSSTNRKVGNWEITTELLIPVTHATVTSQLGTRLLSKPQRCSDCILAATVAGMQAGDLIQTA